MINIAIKDTTMNIMLKYAVLTYDFASCVSFELRATVSLFLKPFPIPKSKKLNHPIKENIVNHKPYFSLPKYDMDKGTRKNVINIDTDL